MTAEKSKVGTEKFSLNGVDNYAVGCAVNAVYALCQAQDIPCLCVVQVENDGSPETPYAVYHNGVWVNEQREDPTMHLLQYLHTELLEKAVVTWELVEQLKKDIRKHLDNLEVS